jgi:hypothetical protein
LLLLVVSPALLDPQALSMSMSVSASVSTSASVLRAPPRAPQPPGAGDFDIAMLLLLLISPALLNPQALSMPVSMLLVSRVLQPP